MSKYKTIQSPVDSRDYTMQTVGLQPVELPEEYEPEISFSKTSTKIRKYIKNA